MRPAAMVTHRARAGLRIRAAGIDRRAVVRSPEVRTLKGPRRPTRDMPHLQAGNGVGVGSRATGTRRPQPRRWTRPLEVLAALHPYADACADATAPADCDAVFAPRVPVIVL